MSWEVRPCRRCVADSPYEANRLDSVRQASSRHGKSGLRSLDPDQPALPGHCLDSLHLSSVGKPQSLVSRAGVFAAPRLERIPNARAPRPKGSEGKEQSWDLT